MKIEHKKDGFFITEQTPSYRDFAVKGKKLYRELLIYIENNLYLKQPFSETETREAIIRKLVK